MPKFLLTDTHHLMNGTDEQVLRSSTAIEAENREQATEIALQDVFGHQILAESEIVPLEMIKTE